MSSYTELLEIIKKASKEVMEASNPAGILFGTVTSIGPLEINVEQKMTLSQEFFILTKNVVDYTVNVTMDWNTETRSLNANHNHSASGDITVNSEATMNPNPESASITIENKVNSNISIEQKNINLSHNHTITGTKSLTIHNALKVGDKVILIQVQGGQRYIVLDKVY